MVHHQIFLVRHLCACLLCITALLCIPTASSLTCPGSTHCSVDKPRSSLGNAQSFLPLEYLYRAVHGVPIPTYSTSCHSHSTHIPRVIREPQWGRLWAINFIKWWWRLLTWTNYVLLNLNLVRACILPFNDSYITNNHYNLCKTTIAGRFPCKL